jgi:hypothetical protein
VKKRLAADVGERAAMDIYLAMLKDAWTSIRTLADVVPYCDEPAAAMWPDLDDLFARARIQRGSTLAARMDHAFADAWNEGTESAVLVGSDIPGLCAGLIRNAMGALVLTDAVVGPSTDGGYYLIGFNRGAYRSELVPGAAGAPVPDGGATLPFEQVLDSLRRYGISPTVLPEMVDVDTLADLRAVIGQPSGGRANLDSAVRRHLPSLLPGEDSP